MKKMVDDGLLKELVLILSGFHTSSSKLKWAEIAANAINNILVCGSENLTEEGHNIFID